MSYTFSVNSGSLESLNPSSRCGFNPNAFQIRPTVDFDSPDFSAIFARDQCVAFFGVDSNESTMTCSTRSTLISTGLPGLGSSRARLVSAPETSCATYASSVTTPRHAWPPRSSKPRSRIPTRSENATRDPVLTFCDAPTVRVGRARVLRASVREERVLVLPYLKSTNNYQRINDAKH